jgi:hypothetical protein
MKPNLSLLWLFAVVVLLTFTPFRARAQIVGYLQNGPERAKSTYQDPGVDLGVVVVSKANLREEPNTSSRVIRQLQNGEIVVLISGVPTGSWYNVIHVDSSEEGWINNSTIKIKYTERRKSPPVFQERETGTIDDPRIEITNDSNRPLYLKLGDSDRFLISPREMKILSRQPGKYDFYASSPGVIPALGEKDFRAGITYQWRFYIVTTRR